MDPAEHTSPDLRGLRARRRQAERRRRRWRRALIVVLSVILVVLLLAGTYLFVLARSFDDNRRTVDAGISETVRAGEPINILLLGSDSRDGVEATEATDPSAEPDSRRSDTMMLVHIPADRGQVYVMSLLRDLYVEIPGWGEDKINAAFGEGGHSMAIKTVEQLLDIPVHHIVEVDFEGFRGVTEALGGVTVCNPTAFSAGVRNPSYYPRGEILLEDTAALRYVRERYAFADGDYTRVQNQQRVVAAAVNRFLSVEILANPARTTSVISTLSSYISTDEALNSGSLAAMGWDLRNLRSGDITMFTVPNAGPDRTETGMSIIRQDPAAMRQLRRALREDSVGEYLNPEPSPSPSPRSASPTAEPSTEPTPSPTATDGVDASPSPSEPAAPTPLRTEVCS